MIERAGRDAGGDLDLHGRLELRDPRHARAAEAVGGRARPHAGAPEVEVDGGSSGAAAGWWPARVEADLQARMLEGRMVTIERIYRDYDDRVHLGVTSTSPVRR